MNSTLRHATSFILSLLAAFFGVLLVLFTDALTLRDQAMAALYVVLTYGILGLIVGSLMQQKRRSARLWMYIPALSIDLLYSVGEPETWLYALVIAIAVASAGELGLRLISRRATASR